MSLNSLSVAYQEDKFSTCVLIIVFGGRFHDPVNDI